MKSSWLMWMRSFMVDLLYSMEKVLPSIIPENLVDEKPLMKLVDQERNRNLAVSSH